MSVSKWAYDPEKCDGDFCHGDCDECPKRDEEEAEGDKIAQLIIQYYASPDIDEVETVDELPETERGDAGFGSTGR